MPKPFVVKEFDGSIEINGKIGIGDDCSSSISYGLLSTDKYYGEDAHRWNQCERLSLIAVGKHLGCLVKDVYYTLAGGNGYIWEKPCAFTLEKDGWIIRIVKKYNYKTGMPFSWKLEKLKHNKKSKSSRNVEVKEVDGKNLYQWDTVSPEVKKKMRDLEYEKNKLDLKEAKERKFLFGEKYDPENYKVDEDDYCPSEEYLEQQKERNKKYKNLWNLHPSDKAGAKMIRSRQFRGWY